MLAPGSAAGTILGAHRFAVKSDHFILATAGEELGLAGLSAIFLLYGAAGGARPRAAGPARNPPADVLLAWAHRSLVALQDVRDRGGVTGSNHADRDGDAVPGAGGSVRW
ncbi:hypothetical protein GCM10023238_20030 [Streptomyces heliomycini]